MKNYRDLDIFSEAKSLAIEVHQMTLTLPKFELYEEGSQLRRCTKSIASLIVEGYGRKKFKADFIKYLIYAHAECDEALVHLEFLKETGSLIDNSIFLRLSDGYVALSKKINNFIQYVETSWR